MTNTELAKKVKIQSSCTINLISGILEMYAQAHKLVGKAVPDPLLTYPPFFRFF